MRITIAGAITAALLLSGCQSVRERLSDPVPNPGPCPNALALYDAHRLVEIRGEDLVYENVGFTGEILNVASLCRYTDEDARPIDMEMGVRMAFGRGPAAVGETKTYTLFVAVTRTDNIVIHREDFPITVTFERGQDRVEVVEEFSNISIPRAEANTSGVNFEVLVGFDLTDEQMDFNRSGLRFRVDAGQG
ncbi:hypothetical protein NHF45_02550 [Maricaulaceae bacterium NA33B04]|nr:hypothetical protein [Maricaulaceae bacterium NA33B04]